jgi:hypothetical protein
VRFRRLFFLNADRVKRRLPSLLVSGPANCLKNSKSFSLSKKQNWNRLMRTRYRVEQLKRKNPEKYNTLTNKLLADLSDVEKAIN